MTLAITALICTRNGLSRGYLDEALRSALEQDPPPAEVLLVDDGSTDGTAAHVRRNHGGVTVLENRGTGLAAARNTGVGAARHPWIAFLDDDDVWCPGKLAEQGAQADACTQRASIIWASRAAAIGPQGGTPRPIGISPELARWPGCLLGGPVFPSGALVSRALLDRFGPFSEHLNPGSIYEFWLRCLAHGVTVRFSSAILLHLRRHGPQMTGPAHLVEHQLAVNALVLPFLQQLEPRRRARIRTACLLLGLRASAMHCGLAGAAQFWARSPLRPMAPGLRGILHILLDSAGARAPLRLQSLLRATALRILLGGPP